MQKPNNDSILIYQSQDGQIKVDVRFEDETVWLTQSQMCELFNKSKSTISEHINNIFDERELDAHSVVRNFRTTAEDGKNYNVNYYNLDVIIYPLATELNPNKVHNSVFGQPNVI